MQEGGKWWCGIHAPSKIAERRAALAAQRDKKYREHEAQYAVEIRRHDLAIACEKAGIYTADDLAKIIEVR